MTNYYLPEREILNFKPYQYKLASWASLSALILLVCFNLKHILVGEFQNIDYFDFGLFIIVFVISSSTKLILTTHYLELAYTPLFRRRIARSDIEKMHITLPFNMAFKQKHPILTKKLFSRKSDDKQDLNLKEIGLLQFIPLHTQSNISAIQKFSVLKQINLQELSKEQSESLLRHLKQDWYFDIPVVNQPHQSTKPELHQDIGKTPLILIFIAVILGFLCVFLPMDGLHFGTESYLGLIPATLLAFILGYIVIRAERKAYTFITTLICSVVLGPCLYFVGLQANRLYNEAQAPITHTHILQLIATNARYQTWQLPLELTEKTGLDEIYINQKWAGFNHNLKSGQSYPVAINEGYFKDFWIQKDAFKHLEPIQGHQP